MHVFGLDGTTLTQLSQIFFGAASFLMAGYGFVQRHNIKTWFSRRETLIAERNVAIATAKDAVRRATAAETLAFDYERNLAELRRYVDDARKGVAENSERLDRLQRTAERAEQLERKLEALVSWTTDLLQYIVTIEKKAKRGGVDLSRDAIPPVPPILADRFSVLETPHDPSAS